MIKQTVWCLLAVASVIGVSQVRGGGDKGSDLAELGGDNNILMRAVGRGNGKSEDNRGAEFQFQAGKAKKDDKEIVRGHAQFQQRRTDKMPPVHIGIPKVERLGVVNKEAEFGGKAILETMRNGKAVRLEGMAVIHVADLVENDKGDQKDKYMIDFKANNSDVTFHWGGNFKQGDVKVWKRK